MTRRGTALPSPIRRASRQVFTDFVADLWAARGWETSVSGPLVAASRGARRRRILVCRRRLERRPDVDVDVDVVVSPTGADWVRRVAAARDATYLSPDDLRSLLVYGVDPAVADGLLGVHFDVGLDDLPPRSSRPAPGAPADDAPERRVSSFPVAVVALLVVSALLLGVSGLNPGLSVFGDLGESTVGALGSGGGGGGTAVSVVDAGDDAAADAGDGTSAGTEERVDHASDVGVDDTFPPGLGADRVVDRRALAAAHAESLDGEQYILRLVLDDGRDPITGERWLAKWETTHVANATNYKSSLTGLRMADNGSRAGSTVIRTAYADGRHRYVRTNERESFARTPVGDGEVGYYERQAADYLAFYLGTTETHVSVVEWREQPFRVVANGSHPGLPDATNYTAEAYVSPSGFVSTLVVTYDVRLRGEVESVRFSLHYSNLYLDTVSKPTWYEAAKAATAESDPTGTAGNGTSTAG